MGGAGGSGGSGGSGGIGGSGGSGGSPGGSGGTGGTGGSTTGGSCDPVAQNCPSGARCTIMHVQPPQTFCDTNAGTVAEYQACRATATSDDCEGGLLCFGTTATSYCDRFCNQDTDCGSTGWCAISLNGTSLHLCMQQCSAATQNCSESGYACYLAVTTSGAQRQACLPAGNLAPGASCATANGCQPGSICVYGPNGNNACRQACDPSAPACAAGSCQAYVGVSGLGFCN